MGEIAIPDEQIALLAAIVAEPDDDTPRLVYADWLQENGDEEQAQFIRDSIKLSLMPQDAEGAEELGVRLLGLEGVKGEGWVKGVGLKVAPLGWERAGFERGLLTEAVYRQWSDFIAERQILFARLPVRRLTFSEGCFTEVAVLPELARLRSLNLDGGPYGRYGRHRLDLWNTLINAPHLSELRQLSVTNYGLADEHLHALGDCQNLPNLTTLDLSGNRMTTSDGQLAILRSPHLVRVKKLSLKNGDEPENRELINLVVARFGSEAPLRRSISEQE